MKMIFDWSGLTKEQWDKYRKEMIEDQQNEINGPGSAFHWCADDYIGCARAGELCFDFVIRFNNDNNIVLTYDLYAGGVEAGYGYSRIEDGYPYDYVDGANFDDSCISLSYEDFQKFAENSMRHFLQNAHGLYVGNLLIELAEKPLHVW